MHLNASLSLTQKHSVTSRCYLLDMCLNERGVPLPDEQMPLEPDHPPEDGGVHLDLNGAVVCHERPQGTAAVLCIWKSMIH
jgi:hypothetical protein